jgi:hypothetical protein
MASNKEDILSVSRKQKIKFKISANDDYYYILDAESHDS